MLLAELPGKFGSTVYLRLSRYRVLILNALWAEYSQDSADQQVYGLRKVCVLRKGCV